MGAKPLTPIAMKRILDRLRSLGGRSRRPLPTPLAICGLGYGHYRIQTLLARSDTYVVQALFDDYPWHHATQVEGVRVYYPSEAPSLARRHGIKAIVYCRESDLAIFDAQTVAALAELNVAFIELDPDGDPERALERRLSPCARP